MKKEIKKNVIFVTTEKRVEKKKFFSQKHPYAIIPLTDEVLSEYEISDNDEIITPTGEKVKLPDYSASYVVVFNPNKILVYGDSPLLYFSQGPISKPKYFDDALKEFEEK